MTIDPGEHEGTAFAGLVQGTMPTRRTLASLEQGVLRRERWEAWAMCRLAGMAAEALHTGKTNWTGGGKDYGDAYDVVSRHVGSHEEAIVYLRLLALQTRQRLRQPRLWRCVEFIANELLARRRLTARQVRAVLRAKEKATAAEEADRIARLLASVEVLPVAHTTDD